MALESEPVEIDAPNLTSVWLHKPSDPEGTAQEFEFGASGRSEALSVAGGPLQFAGRRFPVWDFGEYSSQAVDLTVIIPYDSDWESKVTWVAEELLESRDAWLYRDDRGRLIYGVPHDVQVTDEPYGTSVSMTIEATDFEEEI